ncbi:metalloregulator ArsR/SmtB family transcription factor [Aetokthonos hydrillicola Thurmond2011]|jgi:ArsR family transcriptional regulator|uniref:Metalloregulator ArsR/SmtB family transcription factor n=2 Tax=Aetokthonos TaxID=1550243 RepID=A0AAP5IBT4_9CYAN|nr:metalloregulator ArsR/SmtB family transcription factor [Aetokthonos hydrillicola Thurmond2011]
MSINILSLVIDGCQHRGMKPQVKLSLCCTPLLSAPLSPDEATRIATLFRVLGEPARLQLLSYIASQPLGEACVCELTELLDLSQPTISHHLKVMYEVGLLSKERRGNWIYYKVVPEQIEALQNTLSVSPKVSS